MQYWGGLYKQTVQMNKSPCYLSTLLLGSTRGCPPFSHMWAPRHSCPEYYALQHLLMTKEGAVYTYFYSSIKRWPANKKKNQAHLVLCAECPQINRIRRVFSPHVKISRKNWHWMCTSILRSWNRVLPKSNIVSRSWQLLASHFHFLLLADSEGTGMEMWEKYYSFEWNIPEMATRNLAKARGQRAGPTSPAFSLLALLRHQRLWFPNALTWHWAKRHAEPLVDQTSLKMRLWDLLKILAAHCAAIGRAFPP